MYRQLNEAIRFWWTLRRKPLESFMAPIAIAGDAVLCGDGSLVSLISMEGSRSITGAEELAEFVELAKRRLNASFLGKGHGLHAMLERAPDAAAVWIDAAAGRQRRHAEAIGLDLDDVIGERAERLSGLLAGETCSIACWTRPDVVHAAERQREKKAVKQRLKAWLPKPWESQCPFDVLDSLPARHEAFVVTVQGLLAEGRLIAERLDGHAAVRSMRLLVNGPGAAGPNWMPAGPEDEVWARCTEPPELGAFPPPLATQMLVAEPDAGRSGLRIGDRLYGALDMVLGPRQERPFSELLARIAEAGLPFRFSMRIEGGGLDGFGPVMAQTAASVFAITSEDSRHVRDALAGLREIRGDEQAVVRLSVGLLTWVAADGGEAALARRVSRIRQIAEGWGEAEFSPLVGDMLEALAGSVPGFAFGSTAQAAIAPLPAALGLLPVFRPASSARPERADYLFRSEDGKPLAYSLEESGDFGCDLVHGIPGKGKSVLLGSLVSGVLPAGRTAPASAVGGNRYRAVVVRADLAGARGTAGGPALRGGMVQAADDAGAGDQSLRHHAWLPLSAAAGEGVPVELHGSSADTGRRAGRAGRRGRDDLANDRRDLRDARRRACGGGAASLYARAGRGSGPGSGTPGRASAGGRRSGGIVVDRLFEVGEVDAAGRAQRFAVPTLMDCLQAVREPAVQDLVGETRYRGGGESVTSAVVRILRSLAGEWPNAFSPTAFDTGHVRVAGIDLSSVAPQGSPEADRQTAAMYMLARHALTRHWWIGEEVLDRVPA